MNISENLQNAGILSTTYKELQYINDMCYIVSVRNFKVDAVRKQ